MILLRYVLDVLRPHYEFIIFLLRRGHNRVGMVRLYGLREHKLIVLFSHLRWCMTDYEATFNRTSSITDDSLIYEPWYDKWMPLVRTVA